ncbi:MAG: Calx-beta domain-containing protein, partial [Leptolyngbyaceae cyanobacterium]
MSDFLTIQDSSPFTPKLGLLVDPFSADGLSGEPLLPSSTRNGLGSNLWARSLPPFPTSAPTNRETPNQFDRDITGLSDNKTIVGEADITAMRRRKIKVRGKKETVRGTNSDDIIDASKGKGKNRLLGLGGNDTVIGGKGDRLDGGKGNDTLVAGKKSRQLQFKGGAGDDIFQVFNRRAPTKSHTIMDFKADSDRLWFRNANTVSVNQNGSNTVVTMDGKAIATLRKVSTQTLTQEQFTFVGGTPEIIGIQPGDDLTGDPSTGDPSTGDPSTGDPSTGNPSTGNPSTGNPSTGNPPSDSGITTVQLVATDATASEPLLDENDPGVFTVARSGGDLSQEVTVNYTIDGTAESSTDYTELSGTVTIPAGQTEAQIILTPVDDDLIEGDETVSITLQASEAYAVAAENSATATIVDAAPQVPTETETFDAPVIDQTSVNTWDMTMTGSDGSK